MKPPAVRRCRSYTHADWLMRERQRQPFRISHKAEWLMKGVFPAVRPFNFSKFFDIRQTICFLVCAIIFPEKSILQAPLITEIVKKQCYAYYFLQENPDERDRVT